MNKLLARLRYVWFFGVMKLTGILPDLAFLFPTKPKMRRSGLPG